MTDNTSNQPDIYRTHHPRAVERTIFQVHMGHYQDQP